MIAVLLKNECYSSKLRAASLPVKLAHGLRCRAHLEWKFLRFQARCEAAVRRESEVVSLIFLSFCLVDSCVFLQSEAELARIRMLEREQIARHSDLELLSKAGFAFPVFLFPSTSVNKALEEAAKSRAELQEVNCTGSLSVFSMATKSFIWAERFYSKSFQRHCTVCCMFASGIAGWNQELVGVANWENALRKQVIVWLFGICRPVALFSEALKMFSHFHQYWLFWHALVCFCGTCNPLQQLIRCHLCPARGYMRRCRRWSRNFASVRSACVNVWTFGCGQPYASKVILLISIILLLWDFFSCGLATPRSHTTQRTKASVWPPSASVQRQVNQWIDLGTLEKLLFLLGPLAKLCEIWRSWSLKRKQQLPQWLDIPSDAWSWMLFQHICTFADGPY